MFCQAVREADGFQIALEKQLMDRFLQYWMRRGGEITGFKQVTKPYGLCYGAAKAFNDSREWFLMSRTAWVQSNITNLSCWTADVTNELQNVMLQHASINTFVKHYSVGIHVDAQAIVQGLLAVKQLLQFTASMNHSIDPWWPYKLDDTSCVNDVPCMAVLKKHCQVRKGDLDQIKLAFEMAKQSFEKTFRVHQQRKKMVKKLSQPACLALKDIHQHERQHIHALRKYNEAQHKYWNEWQQQRNCLIWENLERYKNEQPVIDVERQLAGRLVDKEVEALQRTGYMTPQHMTLIDTVLTMPGATVEQEYKCQISAINAVIAFCDVQEGCPSK